MSLHDIVNNIAIEQVLNPQTVQADAVTSGNIDCQGAGAVAVALLVGNIADTLSVSVRLDVKIEHAEDDGTGSPAAYAACTDEDVLNFAGLSGAGVFLSVDAAGKEQKRHVIGYRGTRRFVKVTATPVSLATGGPVAMIALKGAKTQMPVSNS